MQDTPDQQGSNIIRLPTRKATQASERKWGKAVIALGFCIVPSLLLRAQRRLGLNPTELAVLLHLADYWWEPDRRPWPSKKAMSERLGISARQVQRYIAGLERAGLVQRIVRTAPHRGKLSNEYDLSGLVAKLKRLEPEFRELAEKTKAMRRQVARPGGLRAPERGKEE